MFRLESQVTGMNRIHKHNNTAKFFCFLFFVKFSLNKSHKTKNGKYYMNKWNNFKEKVKEEEYLAVAFCIYSWRMIKCEILLEFYFRFKKL